MKNLKLDKKEVLEIVLIILTIVVFREIFYNWEHFKEGIAAGLGLN